MKKHLETLGATQAANADTALALMRNTLDAIERLAALNLNTLRDTLQASAEQGGKLIKAKDLAAATEPSMERTRAYYHQVYELMSDMQEQLTKVMQSHYNALSESAGSAGKNLAASAPMGGDVFATAMKTMLDASALTFERLNDSAHQLQASAGAATVSKKAAPAAPKATSATRGKKT